MDIRNLIERRRNDGSTHWEDCWKEHVDCALVRLADECEEMLDHYSAALDEIYLLRAQFAYEARGREADLTLKTFPKSRRRFAEQSIDRMRDAADGKVKGVSNHLSLEGGIGYRRLLGDRTLTRSQWENRDVTEA